MFNPLEHLVSLFPERDWDWSQLSHNTCLSWKLIEKFPDKPWDWTVLSENPVVTWAIVQANPEKAWNFRILSRNSSVVFSEIREILSKGLIEDEALWFLSSNINITLKDIRASRELPWNLHSLLSSNELTEFEELLSDPVHAQSASFNSSLDWRIIQKFPDHDWNFRLISKRNSNITPEIVSRFEKRLSFEYLSANHLVTDEIFRAYPDADWRLGSLLHANWDPVLVQHVIQDPRPLRGLGEFSYHSHDKRTEFRENQLVDEQIIYWIQAHKWWTEINAEPNKIRSFDPSLDWREVVENPDSFNFERLSGNLFHHSPIRQHFFRQNSRRLVRILQAGLAESSWHQEFELVLFPLRLRLEDIQVRGCPNLKPRLLI
jgi:hypothetical protein